MFRLQKVVAYRRVGALCLTLALLGSVFGCSSSSGTSNNNGGGGGGGGGGNTTRFSTVAGRVTDPDGAPIVGATVTVDGLQTQTTQFGNFRIPSVPIPAGQISRLLVITASNRISGINWTGSNVIEVFGADAITNNSQLVISDPATQGELRGTVRDSDNTLISGASVYANYELPRANPTDPIRWANLGSFLAITDNNGAYSLPDLPSGTRWYIVASYPGRLNARQTNVTVNSGAIATVNFSLTRSSGVSTSPVPDGLFGISLTYPDQPTRSVNTGYDGIRQFLLKKKGWEKRHLATRSFFAQSKGTRAAPVGTHIENIITWDYTNLNNLYGYLVLRSVNVDNDFRNLAILQDSLADRFADADQIITPDLTYYYSISRLDTINYPRDGTEGDPVIPPIVVRPLNALNILGPQNNASVTNPTFNWSAVSRATLYQILVYDRFPSLQSDTDQVNGVRPIWPADPNNPGSSLISDGRTSQAYAGPGLTVGRRYYWVVLASDNVGSAYTISPIYSFIAQ